MYVGVCVCKCVGVLLVNREKKWEKNVNEKNIFGRGNFEKWGVYEFFPYSRSEQGV